MRQVNTISYLLLFALLALFSGCDEEEVDYGKLKVISSFSILSEMIEQVGGNRVEVHNLVPVGMAPHNYEPKPADVIFASKADLFIYNGLGLEGDEHGWLMKLAHSVEMPADAIFCASDGIQPMFLQDDDGHKEENPHAFISPKVGIQMVKNICQFLVQSDPENQTFYEKNRDDYLKKLVEIEALYQQKFSEIPKESRIFVSSEQAFQYLTHDYDFIEGYIWSIDTEKNGTPQQFKNLIHFLQKHQPKVLFVESNVDRRPMEVISKSTGIPIYSKPIYSDELGRKGQMADTYLGYLKYNLVVISEGIGYSLP